MSVIKKIKNFFIDNRLFYVLVELVHENGSGEFQTWFKDKRTIHCINCGSDGHIWNNSQSQSEFIITPCEEFFCSKCGTFFQVQSFLKNHHLLDDVSLQLKEKLECSLNDKEAA